MSEKREKSFQPLTSFEMLVATVFKEEKNTDRAVEKLGVQRTTALTSLRRLQTKIGLTLFDISKAGNVRPRPEAEQILTNFAQIVGAYDAMYASLGMHYKTENPSEIILSSTQTILEGFFAPYIADFYQKTPDLDFSISQIDSFYHIDQRYNEIFLCSWLDSEANEYFDYIPFYNFKQKLWASPKLLEKTGPIETLEDLHGKTLMFFNSPLPKVTKYGKKYSKYDLLKATEKIRVINVYGPRIMDVLAEQGLGIISASEETLRLTGLDLVQVLPDFEGDEIDFYARVNKNFLPSETCQNMLKWIFACRDQSLEKIGMRSDIKFVPK
jgi:DNA-binding transcriptional LysR family regulator